MRRPIYILTISISFLIVLFLSLMIGSSSLNPSLVFALDPIVTTIRLPRTILAAIVGMGLSCSGAIFQAILRNPLADPYIVGISGGAALGGVLALVFGITTIWTLPAFAFAGAAISGVGLIWLAKRNGRSDPLTLLLMGVVFNSFAAAAVTYIKTIVQATKAQEILFWLMGVVTVQPPILLWVLGALCTIGFALSLVYANQLNILTLGDNHAQSVGVHVARTRLICFLAASLMVGAVVSVAGMVGFVGLVVPHIVRQLIGADHRLVIPTCAIGGAIFVLLADIATRLTFQWLGTEIPVGVITAFVGGPFFLSLLLQRNST